MTLSTVTTSTYCRAECLLKRIYHYIRLSTELRGAVIFYLYLFTRSPQKSIDKIRRDKYNLL